MHAKTISSRAEESEREIVREKYREERGLDVLVEVLRRVAAERRAVRGRRLRARQVMQRAPRDVRTDYVRVTRL